MIDLTPLEVRKKKGDFKRTMRGYEPGLVDDFLELVADRMEDLVRENLAHADRLRQLEQQLRDYKERERALTDALVSAQELREEMREQAVREAELARRDAEQDAERIRAEATRQLETEELNLRRLRTRQAQFVQNYRAMLERELEELDVGAEALAYRTAETQAEPSEAPPAQQRHVPPEAPRAAAASPDVGPPEPAAPVTDDGRSEETSAPSTQPEPAARASGERIDDDELERSLEALQVVFARDQEVEEASLDWPEPELPPDPAAFYEPESLKRPYTGQPAPETVPVVLEDDADYELLLEDAIDEEEEPGDGPRPVDSWLPKLIEDEP